MADLATIKTKVRRLTRSLSTSMLSDAELENYINTFVLYDFPEHLRTFYLKQPFSLVLTPFQDSYNLNYQYAANDPLSNFLQYGLTIHPPVYINGYEVSYTQSQDEFFRWYPKINTNTTIATGNGVTTTYTGTIPTAGGVTPITHGTVTLSAYDANNQSVSLVDVPVASATTGYETQNGNLYTPDTVPTVSPTVVDATNTINYETGAYTITLGTAPASGTDIQFQYESSQPSRPLAMMYYGHNLVFRPVPNRPYTVTFDVFYRPTELLTNNQSPELQEWWQYIAYGAAKKVFEDRMDTDSVQQIMPEFKQQERLCLRRTLVQLSNQETATIYNVPRAGSNGWVNWGGQF